MRKVANDLGKVAAITMAAAILTACGGNDASSSAQNLGAQSKTLHRSSKVTGTSAADYEQVTQALYVAYFGRPADPDGATNYEKALLAAGAPTDINGLAEAYTTNTTVRNLIDTFGTSAESNALYGSGTTTSFVTAIFQNVLGRAPQSAGLQFWVNSIDNGSVTKGNSALTIMAGAESNTTTQGLLDAQLVNNRLAAAETFTSTVSSMSATVAYSGAGAAANARNLMAGVTSSTVVTDYQANINAAVQYDIETQNAVDTLNNFRVALGLNTLNKTGPLSIAAQDHATYMADNKTAALTETSGLAGYTYASTIDRATAAGYATNNVADNDGFMAAQNTGSLVGTGVQFANSWIGGPVNRANFSFEALTAIGIGLSLSGTNGGELYGDASVGWKTVPTFPATNYIGAYPAPGSTNVPLWASFDVNAFPNLATTAYPTSTSYPISVQTQISVALTSGTITVTPSGSNTSLAMQSFSSANINALKGQTSYMSFVGNAPFLPNTTYNVVFNGTSANGSISKTWSFTTGAGS